MLNQEENGCAMTYMFEYPQYVPIKMDDQVDEADKPHLLTTFAIGGSSVSKVWVVRLRRRRGQTP